MSKTPHPPSASTDNEDKLNLRIGMLRQWLNEDRIKDAARFVTNEDLHVWLDEAIARHTKEAVEAARIEGMKELAAELSAPAAKQV